MRKVILSVILIVLVVGVSYIQAVRRHVNVDNSFQIGVIGSQSSVTAPVSASDAKRRTVLETSAVGSILAPSIREGEILAYYQERCESLPENLYRPKRQRSIQHIRRETAAKFSITVSELDRIRDSYKINY